MNEIFFYDVIISLIEFAFTATVEPFSVSSFLNDDKF